jgi:DMSO/TMAO reductase YedYZ molybdopterin-dependent catalytic subunit
LSVSIRRSVITGVAAVALAMGTAELLAGLLAGGPSPLDALGQQLIGLLPGGVLTFAIENLGTANRTVLTFVSVLVATGLGAAVGMASRASMLPAVIAFVVAAGLALPASLAQPGASAPTVLGLLTVSVAVGLGLFRWLWREAGTDRSSARTEVEAPVGILVAGAGEGVQGAARDEDPRAHDGSMLHQGRRTFLQVAIGGVAAGAIGGVVGRSLLGGSGGPLVDPAGLSLPAPERSLSTVPASADLARQVPGVAPLFTPNDDFFRIDTAIAVPQVDPAGWTLRVHGLVERELVLDYDDLRSRPMREVDATISCVSNEVGGELVGNARWLGVPLRELLEEAGPTDAAEQVMGRSVDGWTGGFPLGLALDGREALVAVAMNGEALPVRHGFPARLVVPGIYGYVSATKWLAEIELTTWDVDGYWIPRGWAKEGPVKTMSRIDVPAPDGSVEVGATTVAGVAWAPTRGIGRVELRVDEEDWREVELLDALSEDTWVQWRLALELSPGDHELTVRAIDGDQQQQPEGPRPPAPDGAEGWHTIRVRAG